MPVIPTTQEVEAGGLKFEASLETAKLLSLSHSRLLKILTQNKKEKGMWAQLRFKGPDKFPVLREKE